MRSSSLLLRSCPLSAERARQDVIVPRPSHRGEIAVAHIARLRSPPSGLFDRVEFSGDVDGWVCQYLGFISQQNWCRAR